MKIINNNEKDLHIFETAWGISIKLSVKMCLMKIWSSREMIIFHTWTYALKCKLVLFLI